MPKLINRRHEWFAYLRAHGMRLQEAYERAGYVPDRGHACRLASRPDVAERIMELRSDFTDIVTAERPRVVDALMSIGASSRSLGTTSGLKEARFAYLEAARLQQQIMEDLARDREIIERELGHLPPRERRGRGWTPPAEGTPAEETSSGVTSSEETSAEAAPTAEATQGACACAADDVGVAA